MLYTGSIQIFTNLKDFDPGLRQTQPPGIEVMPIESSKLQTSGTQSTSGTS